jgi:hypothetical protein
LITATTKLQTQTLDLLERLSGIQETETSKRADGLGPDDVVDFEVEKMAERLTYELVKGEVMRKRAEAAANANMLSAQSS